ncbi:2-oxoglutarate ferredoxin oxidoreductase subunit beta [Tepidanaerobacter syntrophicus]|uniref:2-oxoacid:ferredoxin oxidoreductase subunit beta n=1 Tax=Tepidanaerobacter syntrophicus TaxID=224999 RepID=UPI0017545433|nr:2-oxoacid:ferredoxin oxidoreductase subunit beta [Tepidanaerobacter syntrophicus]GLI19174.1 2-oxoglutarate ferredoxin oxidoreductase subunit beta [Tepidanaerobacter syntrophicus]GLI50194.1 2-oxoglutarate ferredoxin oxidoreductase subunit beta [Tepidanaerobacter syntrophicus]HHV83600.1 2-oxoacid:ferredoxin oxidoreductase subunit beta [Tepidanaerobacter syntrophicus]
MRKELEKYFRTDKLPHIWCPGCGNGIIMGAVVRAIDNLKLNQDKVCIVSGIGCSSRATGYLNFNTLHTTHGRALAFATGIKMANPDLKVIVLTGDGDCSAIGGNHFIHAARRNIDITTIVFNNNIYGMTSGQYSPMTPKGAYATTAPYGNIDRSFDLCKLAEAAGATYVARGTVYHVPQLIKLIEKAINHDGFSVIDAVAICPTYFGRKNKMGSPVAIMENIRDLSVTVKTAAKLSSQELSGKIVIGEFYEESAPEYTKEYAKVIEKAQGGTKNE